MFVCFDSNEYHHLTIKEIKDYSYSQTPYLYISCAGKILRRDMSTEKGYRLEGYSVGVIAKKGLIHYVLSELDTHDDIFVIGKTTDFRRKTGGIYRCIEAQCIYKEDWMQYYKGNRLTDYE